MNLKVSVFYLEKQKSVIPKNENFQPLSISKKKKALVTVSIFLGGFGMHVLKRKPVWYVRV